ncbi:MAG: selenide, water dikinase [Fimbriimonadales bacterium]|nr:MAG: selenide, water dikinase [Fimbriimonadales bacterium]
MEHPDLLVGFDTRDDAGMFRLDGQRALVQTVDFFTPIVDDPYAYGSIAAANALSDVYAMGGEPMTALTIACFDPGQAPAEVWSQVFQGIHDKCQEAGVVIVGGHTVEDSQPKFGLSVTGIVNETDAFRNTEAKVDDRIFLSKPIGTGIITTAARNLDCPEDALQAAIETMGSLNASAAELGKRQGVRCATDITGFGLVGHLFNVARASQVRIRLRWSQIPLLPHLSELVERGHTTGGGAKNRAYLGGNLAVSDLPEWAEAVLVDPQTSGGLALFSSEWFPEFAEIGEVISGEPGVEVVA